MQKEKATVEQYAENKNVLPSFVTVIEKCILHALTILAIENIFWFVLLQKDKASAEQYAEYEDVFRGFLTVMDECILPALSLLPSNCCLSEQVWSFLKRLKYEYR